LYLGGVHIGRCQGFFHHHHHASAELIVEVNRIRRTAQGIVTIITNPSLLILPKCPHSTGKYRGGGLGTE
jgi:hypothetical protein